MTASDRERAFESSTPTPQASRPGWSSIGPDLGGPLQRDRLHDTCAGVILEPDRMRWSARSCVRTPNCAAVIFFNNVGYLGMCGHGAIGVAVLVTWDVDWGNSVSTRPWAPSPWS